MTINERINQFCQNLEMLYSAHFAKHLSNLTPPRFLPEYGKKYARIVEEQTYGSGRHVYCFIDLENGNILKAAGWKAPAKGARGSIWHDDCDVGQDKPANMNGGGLYK